MAETGWWETNLEIVSEVTEAALKSAPSLSMLEQVLGAIHGEAGVLAGLVRQLNALQGAEGEQHRSWLFERYKGNVAVWYESQAALLRGEVDDG